MRFRLGWPDDLAACHRLLCEDERWRASIRGVADALPEIWAKVFDPPGRGTFVVFEDEDLIVGFAMSAFVKAELARELWHDPKPHVPKRFYGRWREGRALLSLDEVRAANTEGTLDVVALHVCHPNELDSPEGLRWLPILSQSFFFAHAGYRLRSFLGEVYGDTTAAMIRNGGWSLLEDGSAGPEVRSDPHRAYVFGMDRDHCVIAAPHPATLLFHQPPPELHFTAAEQRIMLHALTGMSDRQLATALDLSPETIRSTWDSIYTRIGRARPWILHDDDEPAGSTATRGAEKRRRIVDYVRQHMVELRPFLRATESRPR